MPNAILDVRDGLSCRALVPGAIEDLCYRAELDDKIIREIFWRELSTFLLPKADELVLIVTHDDTGIRAADEVAAVIRVEPDDVIGRSGAVCLNCCHRYLLRKNKRLHLPHCLKPRFEARYRRYD